MLSYPIDEAETLLSSKLKVAKQSLSNCEEDLDFLREQITVGAVSAAYARNLLTMNRRWRWLSLVCTTGTSFRSARRRRRRRSRRGRLLRGHRSPEMRESGWKYHLLVQAFDRLNAHIPSVERPHTEFAAPAEGLLFKSTDGSSRHGGSPGRGFITGGLMNGSSNLASRLKTTGQPPEGRDVRIFGGQYKPCVMSLP